jgi:hypothetical protein
MDKSAHKSTKSASLPFKLRIIRVQQDAPSFATATGLAYQKAPNSIAPRG